MLLALGGYVTRRSGSPCVSPIKGRHAFAAGAANALQNLPTTYCGRVPGRRAAGGSPQRGRRGRGDHRRCAVALCPANGAPVKAIAVDKSNLAGPRCWFPGSTLKSGADLKGKRIATGKGSIGHFVWRRKALEQAGISPKEVQWCSLGPVDAKVRRCLTVR